MASSIHSQPLGIPKFTISDMKTLFISAVLILSEIGLKSSASDIFLNEPSHCGQKLEVNPDLSYMVKPDITQYRGMKTYSSIECKLTFHSDRHGGQICISQEGNLGQIFDNNVQLSIYDGEGDHMPKIITTISYWPHGWTDREYCTDSSHLFLHLERRDEARPVDFSKIKLLFKVQDIRSKDRWLYLEENYCDGAYKIEESQVQIVNRFPYRAPARKVKHLCSIELVRKANECKRTCIVYIPGDNVRCGNKGWELFVPVDRMSLDRETALYRLQCDDASAQTKHVWCASNRTSVLTLILFRRDHNMYSNSTEEPSDMFRIVATDYYRSPESLKEEIPDEMRPRFPERSSRMSRTSSSRPGAARPTGNGAPVHRLADSLLVFCSCLLWLFNSRSPHVG